MSLLAEPSDAILPSTNNVRYTVCRLPKAEMTGSMQTEHIGAATFAVGTPCGLHAGRVSMSNSQQGWRRGDREQE